MKTPGKIHLFVSSFLRRNRRALSGGLALFASGGIAAASASDVVFSGAGYTVNGSTVTLSMANIQNDSAYATGTLRMELFAFTSPYTGVPGSVTTGFQMAVSPDLGTLQADSHFVTSPIVETAAFAQPPTPGTYYITLALTEYQDGDYDGGFVSVYSANLPIPYVVSAPTANGAAFGFSSAVAVGSGYYYDTSVGYIYPLGNGFIYLSDLNRYFYVDPGTDFTTGTYIYDFTHSSFTYTEKSFWPYVYYFDGTGWVATGFN